MRPTLRRPARPGLVAALVVGVAVLGSAAHAQPGTPPSPAPVETPIIDPGPLPLPLYLPALAQRDDRRHPPPIVAQARGFVAGLNASGRRACAPATHVLLRRPEGSVGNEAVAVLAQAGDDPLLTLDLYIDDYVEVGGTDAIAAIACWPVTDRLLGVRRIQVLERPPGAHAARATRLSGRWCASR